MVPMDAVFADGLKSRLEEAGVNTMLLEIPG